MLSKKYYQDFADIMGSSKVKDDTVKRFADYFAGDNPMFDRDRFMKAVKKAREVVE